MTSRGLLTRMIRFRGAERLPYDLPDTCISDFFSIEFDSRPSEGGDEWRAHWCTNLEKQMRQVREVPLKTMLSSSLSEMRAHCRKMARLYVDPQGTGRGRKALEVMCEEFLALRREHPPVYGE